MSIGQFWNVVGLGVVFFLVILFVTLRRGSHHTDQSGMARTTAAVITLVIALAIFVVVSLAVYLLFSPPS